ncbi:hypothetical protein FA15DRAFT_669942 [Coprinopsis marcescibilis]|uniref:Uncharacterized protein n=1 Tax=Coprinopsis marcescibilis TaxID=230819 RepID=A0A5C3KU32_COPMA|nr:hypothetical protein FA15DRAFT_669942 [Coprinopsis marcescibilis]
MQPFSSGFGDSDHQPLEYTVASPEFSYAEDQVLWQSSQMSSALTSLQADSKPATSRSVDGGRVSRTLSSSSELSTASTSSSSSVTGSTVFQAAFDSRFSAPSTRRRTNATSSTLDNASVPARPQETRISLFERLVKGVVQLPADEPVSAGPQRSSVATSVQKRPVTTLGESSTVDSDQPRKVRVLDVKRKLKAKKVCLEDSVARRVTLKEDAVDPYTKCNTARHVPMDAIAKSSSTSDRMPPPVLPPERVGLHHAPEIGPAGMSPKLPTDPPMQTLPEAQPQAVHRQRTFIKTRSAPAASPSLISPAPAATRPALFSQQQTTTPYPSKGNIASSSNQAGVSRTMDPVSIKIAADRPSRSTADVQPPRPSQARLGPPPLGMRRTHTFSTTTSVSIAPNASQSLYGCSQQLPTKQKGFKPPLLQKPSGNDVFPPGQPAITVTGRTQVDNTRTFRRSASAGSTSSFSTTSQSSTSLASISSCSSHRSVDEGGSQRCISNKFVKPHVETNSDPHRTKTTAEINYDELLPEDDPADSSFGEMEFDFDTASLEEAMRPYD